MPVAAHKRQGSSGDGITDYAIQVLTFGLFHAEFVDAVREDGDQSYAAGGSYCPFSNSC